MANHLHYPVRIHNQSCPDFASVVIRVNGFWERLLGMDYLRQSNIGRSSRPILMSDMVARISRPHGGAFAIVATAWFQWQLKGDKEGAKLFVGEPCGVAKMEGWKVEKKNIPGLPRTIL